MDEDGGSCPGTAAAVAASLQVPTEAAFEASGEHDIGGHAYSGDDLCNPADGPCLCAFPASWSRSRIPFPGAGRYPK